MKFGKRVFLAFVFLSLHTKTFSFIFSRWNMLLLPTYSLALLVGIVGGEIAGFSLAESLIGLDRLRMYSRERSPQTFYVSPHITLPKDVKKIVEEYAKCLKDIHAQEMLNNHPLKKTYKFSQ